MKDYAIRTKRSHALRFWIVTLICAAMIGAACWFAYTQTANELTVQLETTVGSLRDLPETEPPTARTAERSTTTAATQPAATRAETTAETAAAAALPETAPLQTQPVTEAAPTEVPEETPLCKPIEGEVLVPFSGGTLVKSPTTGVWQTHNGVDYAAALGDEVCAVGAGVVTQVEEDALWGITVTIDHKNGVLTRYCSLNAGLNVSEGDAVEAGTVIGAVGGTADIESGEPSHLHFEVLKNGSYTDPEVYLAQ